MALSPNFLFNSFTTGRFIRSRKRKRTVFHSDFSTVRETLNRDPNERWWIRLSSRISQWRHLLPLIRLILHALIAVDDDSCLSNADKNFEDPPHARIWPSYIYRGIGVVASRDPNWNFQKNRICMRWLNVSKFQCELYMKSIDVYIQSFSMMCAN